VFHIIIIITNFRQMALLASQEAGSNFKNSLELSPYLHDDARLRLQQFAANAVTSSYLPLNGDTSPPCRQTFKQPFSIDSIIGADAKAQCVGQQQPFPLSQLPGFASQFGSSHCLSVPHNLMMSYRALRPSDPELLSNLTSAYGHRNGHLFPLEYYNSLKSLQQSVSPALAMPIKPTALSALSMLHGQEHTPLKIPQTHIHDVDKMTSEKTKVRPTLGHSVDALLRPAKEHETLNIRPCSSEGKSLESVLESVKV